MLSMKARILIDLSRQSLYNHFVTRDMEAALEYMADDIDWLGPFSCQVASDKQTMEKILAPEYKSKLMITNEQWNARCHGGTWVVSSVYTLLGKASDKTCDMPFGQHATYIWARTEAGPRIVHLHLSNTVDANMLMPLLEPGENAIDYLYAHFDTQSSSSAKLDFHDIEGRIHFLHKNELYSIVAEGPRCLVRHAQGQFFVRVSLSKLEEQLAPLGFVRTHRNCLANSEHFAALRPYCLTLDDGSECPIAERRYRAVLDLANASAKELDSA